MRDRVDQQVRTVVSTPGVPIPSLLRPDDRIVIITLGPGTIEDSLRPPLDQTMDEELTEITTRSSGIFVVEPVKIEARLVENDERIQTQVTVSVGGVIKDGATSLLEPDRTASFELAGGELTIKGVVVRAERNYRFRTHQKYLLALQRLRDGRVALASMPFLIDGSGRLAPMEFTEGVTGIPQSTLYGESLETLIGRLSRGGNDLLDR